MQEVKIAINNTARHLYLISWKRLTLCSRHLTGSHTPYALKQSSAEKQTRDSGMSEGSSGAAKGITLSASCKSRKVLQECVFSE